MWFSDSGASGCWVNLRILIFNRGCKQLKTFHGYDWITDRRSKDPFISSSRQSRRCPQSWSKWPRRPRCRAAGWSFGNVVLGCFGFKGPTNYRSILDGWTLILWSFDRLTSWGWPNNSSHFNCQGNYNKKHQNDLTTERTCPARNCISQGWFVPDSTGWFEMSVGPRHFDDFEYRG